jgi:hypothetical protein
MGGKMFGSSPNCTNKQSTGHGCIALCARDMSITLIKWKEYDTVIETDVERRNNFRRRQIICPLVRNKLVEQVILTKSIVIMISNNNIILIMLLLVRIIMIYFMTCLKN